MSYPALRKCLFPAAGFGTRFLPASKSVPKEMLPVVNKPLIHYGVEEAMHAEMADVCIVYGRHKEALINYFDLHFELEYHIAEKPVEALMESINAIMRRCSFAFARQRHMRGLGDAILTGKKLVGEEAFGVLLADDLCFGDKESPMQLMQRVYQQCGTSLVLVEEVAPDQVGSYGIVTVDNPALEVMQVTGMVEKPEPGEVASNLAIIGRYVLTPDIFPIIEHTGSDTRGEVQITDALAVQAAEGRLKALRFHGKRFDCGRIRGMVEATDYVYHQLEQGG